MNHGDSENAEIMGETMADLRGIKQFSRRLRRDLPALERKTRRQALLKAPCFNVFHALHIDRRETILHSPMLAHLLDPTASHGQGSLFLREFFKVAQKKSGFIGPAQPLNADQWSVRTEVYVGNGSIDLLLECPRQRYLLAIENKVDALEGPAQLWRYYQWMQRQSYYTTRQLIFLTLDGREPKSHKGAPYVRLSYRQDIREFLELACEGTLAPCVKEMVSQYIAVLNDWRTEEQPGEEEKR